MRKLIAAVAAFLLISCIFISQAQNTVNTARQKWVDSVYNGLNDMERIGQLFMVAAYSGGRDYNEDKISFEGSNTGIIKLMR